MTHPLPQIHIPTHNAPCAHCHNTYPRLKLCSACSTVAYCSRDCQKAAWPAHSARCTRHSHISDTPSDHGYSSILYNRPFGGFVSIAQRRMFLSHGPGVILATLSAPPSDYRPAVPSNPARPRTISLRYVPAQSVPTLDSTLACANGALNNRLIERAANMSNHLFPDVPGRYPGQMYVLVTRTTTCLPYRYPPNVSIMMNWLSENHPAHHAFTSDLPLTDAQLIATVFNWDTMEMVLPTDSHMCPVPAEIVNKIISEDFFEQCMRTHRRHNASIKKGEPLSENSLCPPFAKSLSASMLFPH